MQFNPRVDDLPWALQLSIAMCLCLPSVVVVLCPSVGFFTALLFSSLFQALLLFVLSLLGDELSLVAIVCPTVLLTL